MTARILIIDDDAQFLKMICTQVAAFGYEVEEASDGAQGLRQYRKCQPDLVITDLVMARMEGLETIREIKKIHPGARIIAMSGGGQGGGGIYLAISEKLGAMSSLFKPFSRDELKTAISTALSLPSEGGDKADDADGPVHR